jgi:hypothetical protein
LIVAWCLLAVLLWPLVRLMALPFRIVSVVFAAFAAPVKAMLFLPARLSGN